VTKLDLALYDETERVKQQHLDLIEKLILATANELELDQNFEVSITIVDNDKIQEINREYRSIDQTTDVISFAIEDGDDEDFEVFFEEEFAEQENHFPRLLGDIFISIDKTEEQAKDYGHSFERELGFLTVHGFLHLNGFDHQTDEEEKVMFSLQEKILEENGLER